jgi:hypothetical protein
MISMRMAEIHTKAVRKSSRRMRVRGRAETCALGNERRKKKKLKIPHNPSRFEINYLKASAEYQKQ